MKFYLYLAIVLIILDSGCSDNKKLKTSLKAKNSEKIYRLVEMSHADISLLDKEKTVVLLQGGILEEHGPHLPVWSDGYISMQATKDIAQVIADSTDLSVLIFPIIPLGTAGFNGVGGKDIYPGTYAVTFSVLRSIFMNLGTELGEQGFNKIMVVHIHGTQEHSLAIDQACEYFDETYDGFMVNLFSLAGIEWYQDVNFKTEEEMEEDPWAVHADMFETSLSLYLVPDLVRGRHKEQKPLSYKTWQNILELSAQSDWQGYVGSPRLASEKLGEKIMYAWSTALGNIALNIIKGEDYSKMSKWSDGYGPGSHSMEIDDRHEKWLKSKGYLYSR
jgi:creatinine amidohydrolase/Fe(II)-dependent formamide hydrolase-like protein